MTKIENALGRLNKAMDRLEEAWEAVEQAGSADADTERLQEEIQTLRARADEDARLRAEAAGAVREALRDLRGAVARGAQSGG